MSNRWPNILAGGMLGALTFAVFASVLTQPFISFDDGMYVTQNPHVVTGFTWKNVCWAFHAGYAGNWHPLTWLSHMLDAECFGLRPGWHHFTNLAFHTANVILLYVLLQRLTGALWRSVFVSALFAVHPLHVESVAWIAERKDVLSTLFFLLTLLAYAKYAEVIATARDESPTEPKLKSARFASGPALYYLLSLCCFALGLMSKPMVVTAPFVLVLLDYWPLNRLTHRGGERSQLSLGRIVLEKVPFFCLSLASLAITLVAQNTARAMPTGLPLISRVANAIASYWKYLGKTVWPVNLAVFYPHPDIRDALSTEWSGWLVWLGALALVLISAGALMDRKRQPWLPVGWFWFVGTLVPVIGIVQVGQQAMADRYTYIPLIGIFICVAWGANQLLAGHHLGRAVLASGSVLIVASCALATRRQVSFWRDSQTLFEHALAVTRNNAPAECQLGTALQTQGDFEAAAAHFRASLQADPSYFFGWYSLGLLLEQKGDYAKAAGKYEEALRIAPWWAEPHNRLGVCLRVLGQHERAKQQYEEAIRLNPDFAEAHFNLGTALFNSGQATEAASQFEAAARLEPTNVVAQLTLAETLLKARRFSEAESSLSNVIRLCPTNTEAHINLGSLLLYQRRRDEALREFAEAVRVSPQNAVAHFDLATALFGQKRYAEAASQFTEALRLKPDYSAARAGLSQCAIAQASGTNSGGANMGTKAETSGTKSPNKP